MIRLARVAPLFALATCLLPALTASGQTPPPTTANPAVPPAPAAPTPATPAAPVDPIERIKDEAMNRSQVMATLSYLTDVIGPRLTASPNMKRANEWTKDTLTKWGMENAHLEKWGTFGKGWALKRFSMQVVEPQCIPLIAFPKAWSPGVTGPIVGEVIDLDAVKTEAELDKLKGKLKGAFVLVSPPSTVEAHFEPQGTRLTDKELLEMANASEPTARRPRPTRAPAATPATPRPALSLPTLRPRRPPAPPPTLPRRPSLPSVGVAR